MYIIIVRVLQPWKSEQYLNDSIVTSENHKNLITPITPH